VHPDFLTMMLPIIRRDYSLYETYILSPDVIAAAEVDPSSYSINTPITSVAAVRDTCLNSQLMLNWSKYTTGAHQHFEMMEGSHFYLIETGAKERLIDELKSICASLESACMCA
jgi:surfactin synthase thioesterase subunit